MFALGYARAWPQCRWETVATPEVSIPSSRDPSVGRPWSSLSFQHHTPTLLFLVGRVDSLGACRCISLYLEQDLEASGRHGLPTTEDHAIDTAVTDYIPLREHGL